MLDASIADENRKQADTHSREAESAHSEARNQLAMVYVERGLTLCRRGDANRGMLWLARGRSNIPSPKTTISSD